MVSLPLVRKSSLLALILASLGCAHANAAATIIPLKGATPGKGFAPRAVDEGSIHFGPDEITIQGVTFSPNVQNISGPGGNFTATSITPASLGFDDKSNPGDANLALLLRSFRYVNSSPFHFSNPSDATECRFTGLDPARVYQLDLFTVADKNPRETAIQVAGAETQHDTVLTDLAPKVLQYTLKPDASGAIVVRFGFGGGQGDAGLLSAIAITTDAPPQVHLTPATSIDPAHHGITVTTDSETIRLEPWSPGTIRVLAAPTASIPQKHSLAVIAKPDASAWRVERLPRSLALSGPKMKASIDTETGLVTFTTPDGTPLLAQKSWSFKPAPNTARDGQQIRATFARQPGERYFGGGVIGDGFRKPRTEIPLENDYLEMHLPLLYSNQGYGFFWDNASRGKLTSATDTVTWESSAGDAADFYVMAGPQADRTIAEYRHLTGAAPLFPKWAYGFWFSKNKFTNQQEILDAAAKFRQEQIPIDLLVQDYFYWKPDHARDDGDQWGSHHFADSRYPDPKGMISKLHDEDHIHFMAVIWAKFDPDTAHGQELEKAGGLYPPSQDWASPRLRYYDPFNPLARRIYGRQVMDNLLSIGLDAFWMDGAEPEIKMDIYAGFGTGAGAGVRVMSAFPLMHTAAVYDAQREATQDKRVVLLPRSAWAGEQRNSVCAWTSDIGQDWHTLAWQIEGLQNYSICGMPYITTDVGGYNPTAESDRELFVRWFEWGAFCPIFRVHGINRPFPWEYGKEGEDILRKFDLLRYRLLPYTYSQAAQVTFNNGTLLRPLVMDFRHDPKSVSQWDQFMFGPSMLVCPIYQPGNEQPVTRQVYLPAHGSWYDFWTGELLAGGTNLSVQTPLDMIPLYVPAGSILPMGPEVQYASEEPNAPIELRIYRGVDGSFVLYQDQGDGYAYEHGAFAQIPIKWNESKGLLTIGVRKGNYSGMPAQCIFHIVWVCPGHGVGEPLTPEPDKTVTYSGHEITVPAP